MPVESTSIGIRPVAQPQRNEGTESVKSRGQVGSATSGFSPQTNVSIQNAVSDMAGVLSRIAGAQTEAAEKMPQELQQVIDNVLQQAFSMDETLSQGLGSSVESQRFSLDQLSTMARMLSQLGHMADKGQTVDISSDMQALLTNLKAAVTETGGSTFEPVLMAKAAFELLDNNAPENLAPELQQLLQNLQPMGQTTVMQSAEKSEPLAFLRQLVEYMMPRPEAAAYTGEPYGWDAAQQSRTWSAYQDGYGNNNLAGQYSFQRSGGGMTEAGQIVRRQLAQLAAQEARLNTSAGQTVTTAGSLAAGAAGREAAVRLAGAAPQTTEAAETGGGLASAKTPPAGTAAASGAGQAAAAGQNAATRPAGLAAPAAAEQPSGLMAQAAADQPGSQSMPSAAGPSGGRTQTNTAQPGVNGQTLAESADANPMTAAKGGPAASAGVAGAASTAEDSQPAAKGAAVAMAESGTSAAMSGSQPASSRPQTANGAQGQANTARTANGLSSSSPGPASGDSSIPAGEQGAEAVAPGTADGKRAAADKSQPTLADLQQRMQTTDGPQRSAMRQAKAQLMSQTLENTPQTMHTLKDLAQLLLRSDTGRLSPQDTQLLQQAASSRQPVMDDGAAQALQRLIRVCQQNVPASVQQAALQDNLPDLPRVWAFMQLCDMSAVRRMSPRQLHKAGRDISAFVTSMRSAMEGDNAVQPGQRSLSFMIPLYMGEGNTGPVNYPSYIHVYNEEKQNEATGSAEKETWFRVCMLTANIGAVELICRIYDEQKVDMRVFFSDPESAYEFRQVSDEIRQNLQDTTLQLKDFKVTTAG